jgi:hypothetical protein
MGNAFLCRFETQIALNPRQRTVKDSLKSSQLTISDGAC